MNHMKNPASERLVEQTAITVGASVEFDTEHGPQVGVVEDVRQDIGNGQRIAMIYVVGTLNRTSWLIPVEQLQPIKAAA